MKIILPVYTFIYILSITPLLKMFGELLKPAMKLFGLPGESALAIILGNFINLYAAIGVIPQLQLTPKQITTISLMLLTSHSQLLETSVFIKLKTKSMLILFLRIIVAIFIGLLIARI
ncbi:MAG: nucleoside recognition domain-containing protein [candidate division WOR-3 bacterium]